MSSIHMPPQGPGGPLLSPARKGSVRSARQNRGFFPCDGFPYVPRESAERFGILNGRTAASPRSTVGVGPPSSSRPHLKGEHSVGTNPNDPRGHHPTTREGACPSTASSHSHLSEPWHLEPAPAG